MVRILLGHLITLIFLLPAKHGVNSKLYQYNPPVDISLLLNVTGKQYAAPHNGKIIIQVKSTTAASCYYVFTNNTTGIQYSVSAPRESYTNTAEFTVCEGDILICNTLLALQDLIIKFVPTKL